MKIFGLLLLSVVVGFGLSLAVLIVALHPSPNDIQQLLVLMMSTGGMTALLTYVLYRKGAMEWFTSLRWTLLAIISLTVVLIMINVWFVAQLMFISIHDLVLITALLIFSSFISIIAVFLVTSTLIERIYQLANASERLSQGDFKVRLRIQGKDELAKLSQSFNQMANRLQAADEQKTLLENTRRNLLAWISHDLRTPLATIRVMNEAMIDGVASDAGTIERYRLSMQHEIQHMGHLIDDLFELAHLESGRLTIQREPASLRDLISDTFSSMKAQADQQSVELAGQVNDNIDVVPMAADKIQRVLYNIVDNAIRYTPAGGKIDLEVCRNHDKVQISIHNPSFILPSDLPNIFKSFYQGEASRTQAESKQGKRRGTGLGLAIARGFVEAHGGEIWVQSQSQQGTTFYFTLPLT